MKTGTTTVSGKINAQGLNGQDGGFVETSGAKVKIENTTQISTKSEQGKTGTWLIDPTDFTVHADNATSSATGIGAKTLENNLNNTSVQLETQNAGTQAGDIHVNADVTWNKDTTLSLKAHNDIHINANITAQHQDGKVELIYGQND